MTRRIISFPKQIVFFTVIVCILSGCPIMPTIHYSAIQADFNRGDYQKVDNELSDVKIQALDPKLQFNAYTLKAFSEWQIGKYAEAKQTAATAMTKPGLVAGPRDKFFMSILPTLVTSDELTTKYQKLTAPRQITMQTYKNDYESGYKRVVTSLKDAYSQAPADVPDSSLHYARCQRKHALMTWREIMNNIWNGTDFNSEESMNLREEARDRAAKDIQATSIGDEIKKEEKYPCPEPKALITAQATQ